MAALLNSMSNEKKLFVIKYIADIENHRVFKDYQIIIDNLNKTKEKELSNIFEYARNQRQKHKH
ncbi:MAG: hypothetical protein OEY07_00215 [Gammaproteobacteria bacterium]|nr:hypothetical protein [Gammaproteobacteria bacterium]